MQSMGIRELKDHLSEIIDRVHDEGEIVEVTRHGRAVARLVPVPDTGPRDRDSNGVWTELNTLAERIRAQWPHGVSGREILSDIRD